MSSAIGPPGQALVIEDQCLARRAVVDPVPPGPDGPWPTAVNPRKMHVLGRVPAAPDARPVEVSLER